MGGEVTPKPKHGLGAQRAEFLVEGALTAEMARHAVQRSGVGALVFPAPTAGDQTAENFEARVSFGHVLAQPEVLAVHPTLQTGRVRLGDVREAGAAVDVFADQRVMVRGHAAAEGTRRHECGQAAVDSPGRLRLAVPEPTSRYPTCRLKGCRDGRSE